MTIPFRLAKMWFPFWKKRKNAPLLLPDQWILVPLGNPGNDYTCTRHNLGRLLLQRWMDDHCLKPVVIHNFVYGTLYSLNDTLTVLVPSTYMNLSGKVLVEAVRNGFATERMVVIYDDKDLPLGIGRLSKNGSSAGHKGLQSIIDEIGNDGFIRLRLGIGPFQRPLSEWVLGEWTPDEWGLIENMDSGFLKFISALMDNHTVNDMQNLVNNPAFWQ